MKKGMDASNYRRKQAFTTSLEGVIAASKEIIVAPVAGLAVR